MISAVAHRQHGILCGYSQHIMWLFIAHASEHWTHCAVGRD